MQAINSAKFAHELDAAGLRGLPFAWGEDGSFCFSDAMTPEQIGAVEAVYAAHDPAPVTVVPQEVSRRQARQAMREAGISFAAVQAAIDAIADPLQRDLMQIEWEDSQVFQRRRPQLVALAVQLGLDDAALDALFVQAGRL